jgi:hypothetical protein
MKTDLINLFLRSQLINDRGTWNRTEKNEFREKPGKEPPTIVSLFIEHFNEQHCFLICSGLISLLEKAKQRFSDRV